MLKNKFKFISFIFLLLLVGCAKRGTITGGLKDTIAPVLKMSFPKNYSVNFQGSEIQLNFDEYIKLKNVNKQLIISPPMKVAPEVLPTNPSKIITIKLKDTLLPNTTYSFNFGQSIADNNENNPYNQFKYVFSTGTYIDSLILGGSIKDALNKNPDNFVSILLYEINETYTDSSVYKSVPNYITNTLDSLKVFKLENLKAGKYQLVALKDKNSNNKFNSKEDKIGFLKHPITIPNDTVFELELFKEIPRFKANKPTQGSSNRLIIGYEGTPKDLKVTLKNGTIEVPSLLTKVENKDSVHVWFKPIKTDSIQVALTAPDYTANYSVKYKEQKKDTLSFTAKQSGLLLLREKFTLNSSIPLVQFDTSKIKITDKDSVAVDFTTNYDDGLMALSIDFEKKPLQRYTFDFLPGALTDFFGKQNDTLTYALTTKNTSDYGNLRVNLQNVKRFPVLVELTNSKGDVVETRYSDKNPSLVFDLIDPALYTLRVIYDENNNKEWDSGNYLEKRFAEEVIYFPKEIDVRANWDVEQVFDLSP